jgi:tRNA pseudouridine13 synthase
MVGIPSDRSLISREYSLPGGYRKIIHRPTNVTWRHIRYTDPDIALTQSDEDRLLGENPAAEDAPEGKFSAVQIEFELSAAVYATMALREVTREETSAWHHAGLTLSGDDREYKGTGKKDNDVDGEAEGTEMKEEGPEVKAEGEVDMGGQGEGDLKEGEAVSAVAE